MPVTFDTASLGTEQPLIGQPSGFSGEDCDRGQCDIAVEREVDGFIAKVGVQLNSEGLIFDGPTGGTGFSVDELMVDGFGSGGAIAVLDGFTSLDSSVGPRRFYAVAGLPLDAAVVAMELADGTKVWQRPESGMVLLVDEVGSMPERFRDYYDQDGGDPDELEELDPVGSLFVLDGGGREIMRIENSERGRSVVTNLRIDSDGLSRAIETPLPNTPRPEVMNPIQPERTTVIEFASRNPTDPLTMDLRVSKPLMIGDVLWVPHVRDQAELVSLVDVETLEVIDTIDTNGMGETFNPSEMHVAAGGLWIVDRDSRTIARIDLVTRQVTDTITLSTRDGNQLAAPVFIGETLWMPRFSGVGDHWLEIDLAAGEIIKEWPIDSFAGWWVTAVDEVIWSYEAGFGIHRFDTETGQTETFPYADFPFIDGGPNPSESCCLATDEAIWLVSHVDGLARFDLNTHEFDTVDTKGVTFGIGGVIVDGAIWVPGDHGAIYRIDTASRQITDQIQLGLGGWVPTSVTGDSLWLFDHPAGGVRHIDMVSRQATYTLNVQVSDPSGFDSHLIVGNVIWIPDTDGTLTRIEIP